MNFLDIFNILSMICYVSKYWNSDRIKFLVGNIFGVQISFEGFFGGPSFVNPSKLIRTPNTCHASLNENSQVLD